MNPHVEPIDSRTRILDAAETLFGDKGIHPTSIRDITAAAGVNLAAVNYHFGSKEKLLGEVVDRRVIPINLERIRLLDTAERAGRPVEIETILEAFLIPTVQACSESPSLMKLAGRLVSEPDPILRRIFLSRFEKVAQRFINALGRSLPSVEPVALWSCFLFLIGSMVHCWTNRGDLEMLAGKTPDADEAMLHLIRYTAAGLRGMEESR